MTRRQCAFCLEPIRECVCDEDDPMAEAVAQAWMFGSDEGDGES